MIEIDRTDEEREEQVKQWIKGYWKAAVGAVGLAIAIVWSTNVYRQSAVDGLSETAARTEKVFMHLGEKKLDEARKETLALQDDESNTSFSVVATLALAKDYFEAEKYTEAAEQYDWIIDNAGDLAMRNVARLRKARSQSNGKQNAQAIETIDGLEGQGNAFEASLLKGDIHMGSKQYDKAKQAYESVENEGTNEVIKQRLQLLTIKQQQKSAS